MYLVFYDDKCPFCCNAVEKLKKMDRDERLSFAPLHSELATLHGIKEHGELVFYDHGQLYFGGKGVMRILWRIGGRYKLPGLLCFLPSFIFKPLYTFIAKRRYRL